MAVDVRCNIICNLGQVISGQVGDELLTEPGLIRTTGNLVLEGLTMPAKGAQVQLAYHRPQAGQITRFPRRLRVLRATADPYRYTTAVEIGCLLALKSEVVNRSDTYPEVEDVSGSVTTNASYILSGEGSVQQSYEQAYSSFLAQDVLEYCLQKVGVPLASSSYQLRFGFLREPFDLSSGYLSVAGDLIGAESCYGALNMAEQLVVRKVDLTTATTAPVLRDFDLIDLQPVTGGRDPADEVITSYAQFGR